MPFKKTHLQGSLPSEPLFIGRANELLFFIQQILKPEEPTYNILSVWGQGGVGKTTLLRQFKNQTAMAEFKTSCLTAWVDERQTTPANMMEKFALQLHLGSSFEKALHRYKEALQSLPSSRPSGSLQQTVVTKAPDLAGSLLEGIPIAGPPLREITKAATEHFLGHSQTLQERSTVPFNNPLDSLTQVFLTEMNHLAEGKGTWLSGQSKRGRRVLLFFDTFEQVADEIVPWLLHTVLEMEINPNIVFIIAGRDPLERSTIRSPKQWLPYYQSQTVYALPMQQFTQRETAAYLTEQGITTKEQIETIWHLSHGLPLYLGLLTSNMPERIDPTKDVVDNFLRGIPDSEPMKRRLALDAALFSKPFNLDDLEAFLYLSEQDRPALYTWLIRQSFVRPSSLDGRYLYHDLAQKLFQRYISQHSPSTYYTTRTTLATYYQRRLEHLQTVQEKNRYGPSDERLEVMLALASQRFFLSDEESHFQALLPLFDIVEYEDSEQMSTLIQWLRNIIQILSQASSHALQVAQEVLCFLETSPRNDNDPRYMYTQKQEWLQTAERLLKLTKHSRSPELTANIYGCCGWGHFLLKEYQQTLTCFEHALELCPRSARMYNGLGWGHFFLKEYQQAIDDFNDALDLAPFHPHSYLGRGRAYDKIKAYQQALNDLDRTLQLDWRIYFVYMYRARIYMTLKEYRKALAEWDHTEVGALLPKPGIISFRQGCAHLWLKELPQATACFTRGYERAPAQDLVLWARERSRMCQTYPDAQTLHHLNEIARGDRYLASVSRGVIFFLQRNFKHAVTELQHATILPYDEDWEQYTDSDHAEDWHEWDAPFWLGMTYLALNQEQEARIAIEQALALEMPPILLKPLCWFEREKPIVYEQFVKPLLTIHEV